MARRPWAQRVSTQEQERIALERSRLQYAEALQTSERNLYLPYKKPTYKTGILGNYEAFAYNLTRIDHYKRLAVKRALIFNNAPKDLQEESIQRLTQREIPMDDPDFFIDRTIKNIITRSASPNLQRRSIFNTLQSDTPRSNDPLSLALISVVSDTENMMARSLEHTARFASEHGFAEEPGQF